MLTAIRNLPKSERPRERLCSNGSAALSLQELLAVIFSNGTKGTPVSSVVSELILKYPDLEQLWQADIVELLKIKGLGLAKTLRLKASLELGKRFYEQTKLSLSESLFNSFSAARLAAKYLQYKTKEHLLLFCLNNRSQLIDHPEIISIGTLDCSIVHPRDIFKSAIKKNAATIMLAHNHPSGIAEPSDADLLVTSQINKAGQLMNMPLVDHLILAWPEFTSLRQTRPELF